MKISLLIVILCLISVSLVLFKAILPVQLFSVVLAVSLVIISVLLSLLFISGAFSEKNILSSEKILELEMPNSNVQLIKIDGELKEVKIGNDSYSNIDCKNENPICLKVLKNKIENRWKFICFNKKDECVVMLE